MLAEHAAQVGPAPALAQDLSRRIAAPVHVLTTPLDGAPLAPDVAQGVLDQLGPGDTPGTVQRFLDHWRPDFALVIGTPARERLLTAAARRGIPLFHAAPRRDAGGAAGRFPAYLNRFHTCFAASAADAAALRNHLKKTEVRVEITGPLSDTVHALPCNEAECTELSRLLGGRPVWLAAEVDGLEIDIVAAAHRKAFRSAHRLLLILVPRPEADARAIAARLEAAGWRVALRSDDAEPDPDVQIYVADTRGELGLWYRLAPMSFIGGTLDPGRTPSDPYAAAALGSAVLHGPRTGPSPARFEELGRQRASVLVRNAGELGEAVVTLLSPDKTAALAQAGWGVTTESAHVVERLAEIMGDILDEREGIA